MSNVLDSKNKRIQQCPVSDGMDEYKVLAYVKHS